MAVETVVHKRNRGGVDQTRKPSPAIWGDCPWAEINDPRSLVDGITFFDDFHTFGEAPFATGAAQTTSGGMGPYKIYCATAGTWAPDDMPHATTYASPGGIISALCDTANDQAAIGLSNSPLVLTTTQAGGKIWFEARIATTSILTNMGQIFCGLGEVSVLGATGFTSAVPLADTDTNATSLAMIGFQRTEDGLGVLNTVYADHASPFTAIQASANSTLAANTWIKLGIKIDFADTNRCVRFFVDNVECSTAMTKAALLALTHVDVKCVGPLLAFYADSAGTADYIFLDWWGCAQVFTP